MHCMHCSNYVRWCITFCSGIDLAHPEFEGRAKFGIDTVEDPPRHDDPNGHGTHVAGEYL